jgi:hypothetical protein
MFAWNRHNVIHSSLECRVDDEVDHYLMMRASIKMLVITFLSPLESNIRTQDIETLLVSLYQDQGSNVN